MKPTYDKQELVRYLWPADDLYDANETERRRTRGKIDKELSHARQALQLDEASGFLKSTSRLVVERAVGNSIAVISDIDEFRTLATSSKQADLLAALALVRGEVAAHLPKAANIDWSWLEHERRRQRNEIKRILTALHSDATVEELDGLCQDVLDGLYQYTEPPAKPVLPSHTQMPAMNRKAALGASAGSKRGVIAASLIVCAVVGGSLLALILRTLSQTTSASIPPPGSIVNTWTGHWSSHIPSARTEYAKAQLEGGESTLRACDLSAGLPCAYLAKEQTITARLGDIIEIKYRLYDVDAEPIPYVKLNLDWGSGGKHESRELGLDMLAAWPLMPTGVEYPAGNDGSVAIQLPVSDSYHLMYIPGSTALTSSFNHRLLFRLPDGIMSGGIGLEDVGSPRSCFECADEYERLVSFRAKITS